MQGGSSSSSSAGETFHDKHLRDLSSILMYKCGRVNASSGGRRSISHSPPPKNSSKVMSAATTTIIPLKQPTNCFTSRHTAHRVPYMTYIHINSGYLHTKKSLPLPLLLSHYLPFMCLLLSLFISIFLPPLPLSLSRCLPPFSPAPSVCLPFPLILFTTPPSSDHVVS